MRSCVQLAKEKMPDTQLALNVPTPVHIPPPSRLVDAADGAVPRNVLVPETVAGARAARTASH